VLAGGAAASGLPFYAIVCLPILFAAGMSLFDTIDGAFMNFAYGWAFSKPIRKIFYNMTITGLSVAVALLIGTAELLAVLADRLSLTGGPWDFVSHLDLNLVGYLIVGLFALTWAIALAVWRFGHIEERWSANLQESPAEAG
jgi:high-affinity nickel-transport protein